MTVEKDVTKNRASPVRVEPPRTHPPHGGEPVRSMDRTGADRTGAGRQAAEWREKETRARLLQETPREFDVSLLQGFSQAVEAAIAKAHTAGLAVPGRDGDGAPVERRPGGQIAAIDESIDWSPEAWKTTSEDR